MQRAVDTESLQELGWPDAECFARSCALYERADTDYNGLVDLAETIAMRQRLGQLTGVPLLDPTAEHSRLTTPTRKGQDPVQQEMWSDCMRALCKVCGPESFKRAAVQILLEAPPGQPKIVVGPVIGKVTDTSARILVELSHDVQLTCIVQDEARRQQAIQYVLQVPRSRPIVFKLGNLMPDTRYTVRFVGAVMLVDSSSFRTFPKGGFDFEKGSRPRFVVASCNCVYTTRELPHNSPADLWRDLEMRMRGGTRVDCMLHLGDNVYNDHEWCVIEKGKGALEGSTCKWGVAHSWLSSCSKAEWPKYTEDIIELFRMAYRETWGHSPTRWVLANVANLMLFDDHDIRDDWGDRPEDVQPDSVDYHLGRIGYYVVNQYQRQLLEDLDQQRPITSDFFHLPFGDVGFMFVDVRGCKTFHRAPEDEQLPMLGVNQWRSITDALSETGTFRACRALLVLTPEPVAYVSGTPTMIAGKTVCDDLLGQWSAEKHQPEVPRLLNILTDWKRRHQGREVMILGGDVHEAGWTDIVHTESQSYIRQLTTSAISQKMTKPHEAIAVVMTRSVASGVVDGFDLTGGWTSRHFDWTNRKNYAILESGAVFGGVLKIRVMSAKNLRAADFSVTGGGSSDPYVVVKIGGKFDQKQTKVINKNLNPVWNSEEFCFYLTPEDTEVVFKLYDKDLVGSDNLGRARVDIFDLPPNRRVTKTVPVVEGQGELTFEALWESSHAPMELAPNLPKQSFGTGLPVMLSGQLVCSDSDTVEVLKRRGANGPMREMSRGLTDTGLELGKQAKHMIGGLFS